ncbi:XisI protein [Candidatus Entotheonella palauensis]|uniref:XisI protein n=1 Tax=Candidatus Entotheonella gemina TaxID=1429439 RepID=W4LWW0_9BACT|nr:XisI protein [Candidatus Entotheonella palauensis]ETX02246.1 MAG: hypothetical protein ETSY2_35925 [Candidatus Entotheonella gemina]
MDKLITYRKLIQQFVSDLAAMINEQRTEADVLAQCVFDEERDQYLLLKIGWSGQRRIRGTTLYVRLLNNKFWIEEDMTEEGIATELLKAGVPHQDIVLAFQPPNMRSFTEFATA